MKLDANCTGPSRRETKRGCVSPLLHKSDEVLIRAARYFLRRVGS
jgi:hypothetical protein